MRCGARRSIVLSLVTLVSAGGCWDNTAALSGSVTQPPTGLPTPAVVWDSANALQFPVSSARAVASSALFVVATSQELMAYHARSGAQAWWRNLGPARTAPTGLAWSGDSVLILLRGDSVMAFSADSGRPHWTAPVGDAGTLINDTLVLTELGRLKRVDVAARTVRDLGTLRSFSALTSGDLSATVRGDRLLVLARSTQNIGADVYRSVVRLTAIDLRSMTERWRTPADTLPGAVAAGREPIVAESTLVVWTTDALMARELSTGALRWRAQVNQTTMIMAPPAVRDGRLYALLIGALGAVSLTSGATLFSRPAFDAYGVDTERWALASCREGVHVMTRDLSVHDPVSGQTTRRLSPDPLSAPNLFVSARAGNTLFLHGTRRVVAVTCTP